MIVPSLPTGYVNVFEGRQVEVDMSRENPGDADMVSDEEFTELLADVEGTTPEEIERGAVELDIAPPEEATVVDE
jgi:antitoxin component of MazEF toxin-antitoxin module